MDEEGSYDESIALKTYGDDNAVRVTNEFFYIFPFSYGPGDLVEAGVAINGQVHRVRLWLDETGDFIDAGPADAGLPDADPSDADLPDSDLADAEVVVFDAEPAP